MVSWKNERRQELLFMSSKVELASFMDGIIALCILKYVLFYSN